jgi:hypothetical protein
MSNKKGDKTIGLYFSKDQLENLNLTGPEMKTLIIEARELFSLLRLTREANTYLGSHPKLKEVIEKW